MNARPAAAAEGFAIVTLVTLTLSDGGAVG